MSKNKNVRRLIERAIEECRGSEFKEVRGHLAAAIRETKKIESRDESRKKETPHQKWTFDIQTGSIRNLTRKQMSNALDNIEEMINKEKKKGAKEERQDVITG